MEGKSGFRGMAKHILKVAPKMAKVVLENDAVRVIVITMKKGQRVPMHSHNRGLSYSLNDGKIRSRHEDGRSKVIVVKKGELSWSTEDGAETHAVDNLGGILRELSVELKSQ
jgi:quercetin dioxygenase-like cupin family protein